MEFQHTSTIGDTPIYENCSISSVLDEVSQLFQSEIDEKQLKVKIDVPEDAEFQVDKQSMEQVFFNLLENAVEASTTNGTIIVTSKEVCRKKSNLLVIMIRDYGAKFSKDAIDSYLNYEKLRPL